MQTNTLTTGHERRARGGTCTCERRQTMRHLRRHTGQRATAPQVEARCKEAISTGVPTAPPAAGRVRGPRQPTQTRTTCRVPARRRSMKRARPAPSARRGWARTRLRFRNVRLVTLGCLSDRECRAQHVDGERDSSDANAHCCRQFDDTRIGHFARRVYRPPSSR